MQLAFYDIGLVGSATVLKVSPCPTLEAGQGRLVLTTMCHKASNVLDLKLAGLNQAVGVTDTHRIYSEDRGTFVPAGELEPGERVRTQDGWAVIESVNRHRQIEEVYNLEVETEHVYFASSFRVLVHNDCPGIADSGAAGDAAAQERAKSLAKGVPPNQIGPSGKPKIHVVEKPTRKQAKEAARNAGGSAPVLHNQDSGQPPHYHAVDNDGNKLTGKDNVHNQKRGAKPNGG